MGDSTSRREGGERAGGYPGQTFSTNKCAMARSASELD